MNDFPESGSDRGSVFRMISMLITVRSGSTEDVISVAIAKNKTPQSASDPRPQSAPTLAQ